MSGHPPGSPLSFSPTLPDGEAGIFIKENIFPLFFGNLNLSSIFAVFSRQENIIHCFDTWIFCIHATEPYLYDIAVRVPLLAMYLCGMWCFLAEK